VLVLGGLALALVLAVARYGPLAGDATAMRAELRSIASRIRDEGPRIRAESLAQIRANADRVKARHARIAEALAGDPLVGLVRLLPGVGSQVKAADDLVGAAGLLIAVMDEGLRLGVRYVEVRDEHDGPSTMEALVTLAAEAQGDLATATDRVDRALALLDRIPDDAVGPVRAARDEAREQLGRYRPVLGQALEAAQFLPSFLGWDRPKRYLVLPQDPAELRPTGGYIGQYGIVVFDRGRIVEKTFHDISVLDGRSGLPYVEPPAPLLDHLHGPTQSWRLADANWSPDFPSAARQAEFFYRIEAQDQPIDGVIGLTTYAIDELLGLTGPIYVPGFDVTIQPGDTTFGILAETRQFRPGGQKAILGPFADRLLEELFRLPPSRWTELVPALDRIRAEHLAAVWMTDPALQAAISRAGWDGALPVQPGDELLIVEANVGPVSKLHLVTDHAIDLDVTLDLEGNAHAQLALRYNNHIEDESADARTRRDAKMLLDYQRRSHLGLYVRLLVPLAARIAEVRLDAGDPPIGGLEAVGEELGRRSFGAYAIVPPGEATLEMAWVTPGVVERGADGRSRYRLSMRKPPGRLADPLRVAIHLPPNMRLVNMSDATLTVDEDGGGVIVLREGPFRSDVTIDLQFEESPPGG
jgi:hypothetical protein